MFRKMFLIMCLCLIWVLPGCIPKSPSAESIELTKKMIFMIDEAKTSHLAMTDEFSKNQQEKVERYFNSITDEYWKTFYSKPAVKAALMKEYQSDEERQKVLQEISEAGAMGLYQLRSNVFSSVDKLDRSIRNRISQHYDSILLAANTILNYLQSTTSSQSLQSMEQMANEAYNKFQQDVLPLDQMRRKMDNVFNLADGSMQKIGVITETLEQLNEDIQKNRYRGGLYYDKK